MYLILFLIGMVVAFAGALLVLYAVPVVDVAAAALFSSGIFAIVGALILMALAAVARSIGQIAERLEVQPLSAPALPPVATIAREEPVPRPARVEPAPAAPAAPPTDKKTSLLSTWLNRASPASAEKKAPQLPEEPIAAQGDLAPLARAPDEPRAPDAPTSAAPTSAPSTFAPAAMEPMVAVPPIAASPPPVPPAPAPPAPPSPPMAAPAPAAAPAIPHAVAPASRPAPWSPPPAASAPEATVYKSGVIDGMAYTLFMDGAIEAELPQGRVRFASVDELQKYLTNRP